MLDVNEDWQILVEYETNINVLSSLSVTQIEAPIDFGIINAYPNPFNPSINIEFSVPELSDAMIKVIGMDGRYIQTIASGVKPSGLYRLRWTPNNIATGMYLIQFQSGNQIQSKKFII